MAILPSSLAWRLARGSRDAWSEAGSMGLLDEGGGREFLVSLLRLALPLSIPGALLAFLLPAVVQEIGLLMIAHWAMSMVRLGFLIGAIALTNQVAAGGLVPGLPRGLLWVSCSPFWLAWPLAAAPQLSLLFIPILAFAMFTLWRGLEQVSAIPRDGRVIPFLTLVLAAVVAYGSLYLLLGPFLYAVVRLLPLP